MIVVSKYVNGFLRITFDKSFEKYRDFSGIVGIK